MSTGILVLAVLILAAAGFLLGRRRALSTAGGDPRRLHSLPGHYGQFAALFAAVPALAVLAVWLVVQPVVLDSRISAMLPAGGAAETGLLMADVRRISEGLRLIAVADGLSEPAIEALVADDLGPRLRAVGAAATSLDAGTLAAAKAHRILQQDLHRWMAVVVAVVAVAGFLLALLRIHPDFRARNVSERFVMWLLVAASLVAVATTAGIVLSLVFETVHFFQIYPIEEFFLSLTWNPQFRGGSDLGIWPLLWGTMYISVIALVVAVPIGLLTAIYLSEYASRRMRGLAKPAIEILAGIPTIVYGLFALITVGPALRDWFAQPLGLGASSSSVMTAGLVMGIMLIPFVSSLSDDIINAVPQSLRDGSYGLGATPSETVKQVVLPAALPGIVGAILLAASRAIGETMIVVLGAGAAAKMSLNPFEAMTTVTVKIVSQLTGDTEFASPETLVAFALGLTLFVITLMLNVLALYIVRKYREQYE
ncbi:phosphate ABC transporter permease subunit PstC [Cereibacter sphaeroides]|uniref:phosphate ABC transporter permease subunit PstC n=1 Tax=Cereibacter sphaeroides TaxID=1063 RepID=UPI001F172F88|nr:phosphate ABC transporter permease subunit PstC [Cereibacter sphaeroides]MCE6961597.1 phosphate ABC transporter permease subunit PstC [Cereibacter sphaeroides]MCE6974947.1 phosphate ABC transporter permease subunit PstC [Cereibacter sphaeroides]